MWRALAVFAFLMVGAGVYVLATGGAAPAAAPASPSKHDFGFALAAGSIALAATFIVSRPRFRFRR